MKEYQEAKDWHQLKILERVRDKLIKRDFEAVILKDSQEIKKFIEEKIPKECSVGIGGSVTVRELGLDILLKERGNIMNDHWDKSVKPEEALTVRKNQLRSDFFLTSINALTMEGQIVNIDGMGNRVASMIFGPGHVIAITGINKIAADVEQAIWRIKNIASPANSKRLGLDTPCAKSGYCADCKTAGSVCRITTIIDYRPIATAFTVILVPMVLGY